MNTASTPAGPSTTAASVNEAMSRRLLTLAAVVLTGGVLAVFIGFDSGGRESQGGDSSWLPPPRRMVRVTAALFARSAVKRAGARSAGLLVAVLVEGLALGPAPTSVKL